MAGVPAILPEAPSGRACTRAMRCFPFCDGQRGSRGRPQLFFLALETQLGLCHWLSGVPEEPVLPAHLQIQKQHQMFHWALLLGVPGKRGTLNGRGPWLSRLECLCRARFAVQTRTVCHGVWEWGHAFTLSILPALLPRGGKQSPRHVRVYTCKLCKALLSTR